MRSRSLLVAWLLALAPYLLLVASFDFVCDDAYISFRYARNLVEGEGLRFNPGESPPVEGYSNLLWVLLLAGAQVVGIAPALAARAMSVVCGATLLLLVLHHAREREGQVVAPGLAALFLATLPPFFVWSTGGLATLPAALLLFALHTTLHGERAEGRGWRAGLLAATLVLLRADGHVLAVIVIGVAAAEALLRRNRALLFSCGGTFGFLILAATGQLAFRWLYHQELLPNTVRAKVGLSGLTLLRGFDYVASLLLTFLPVLLVLGAGMVAGLLSRSARTLRALAITLGILGYCVVVGGDFMAMGRFMVPTLPFVALVLASLLSRWDSPRARSSASLLTAALVILSLLPAFDVHVVPATVRETFDYRWSSDKNLTEVAFWRKMKERSEDWSRLGKALRARAGTGDTIVLAAIGAVGYESRLPVLDRCGLVTGEVARLPAKPGRHTAGHEKLVPTSFFLDRRPAILEAVLVDARNPGSPGVGVDLNDPIVRSEYEVRVQPLGDVEGFSENDALRTVRRKGG